METKFEYYTGANYKDFAVIPKCLFTEPRFKGLSYGAILLYALLLDRMSLSEKNGWLGTDNRAYIYFTIENVMNFFNIGKNKSVSLFKELELAGLIYKEKQNLGKPARIYVMDCTRPKECGKSVENSVENSVESFLH